MLMLPLLVMKIFLLWDATMMTRLGFWFRSWSIATVVMLTTGGWTDDWLLRDTFWRIFIEVGGDAVDFVVWEGVSCRGSLWCCEMNMGIWIRAIATTASTYLGTVWRVHRVHGIIGGCHDRRDRFVDNEKSWEDVWAWWKNAFLRKQQERRFCGERVMKWNFVLLQ